MNSEEYQIAPWAGRSTAPLHGHADFKAHSKSNATLFRSEKCQFPEFVNWLDKVGYLVGM